MLLPRVSAGVVTACISWCNHVHQLCCYHLHQLVFLPRASAVFFPRASAVIGVTCISCYCCHVYQLVLLPRASTAVVTTCISWYCHVHQLKLLPRASASIVVTCITWYCYHMYQLVCDKQHVHLASPVSGVGRCLTGVMMLPLSTSVMGTVILLSNRCVSSVMTSRSDGFVTVLMMSRTIFRGSGKMMSCSNKCVILLMPLGSRSIVTSVMTSDSITCLTVLMM